VTLRPKPDAAPVTAVAHCIALLDAYQDYPDGSDERTEPDCRISAFGTHEMLV